MTSAELLVDAVGRVRQVVHRVVDGLTPEHLAFRVDPGANSIAWLVWHLTRIQDDHLAAAFPAEQVWTVGAGWSGSGCPSTPRTPATDTRPRTWPPCSWTRVPCWSGITTVHQQTLGYVGQLTDADLGRVVDRSWDPPVTLGVRLVSVIADDLQHAGQAA